MAKKEKEKDAWCSTIFTDKNLKCEMHIRIQLPSFTLNPKPFSPSSESEECVTTANLSKHGRLPKLAGNAEEIINQKSS